MTSTSQKSATGSITAVELESRQPRPRIIDVREPDEFNGPLGHIPGAELVPLATLESAASSWSKSEPLVIACRSGARSAKGVAALERLGFRNVLNLTGGTQGHVEAGLRVDRA